MAWPGDVSARSRLSYKHINRLFIDTADWQTDRDPLAGSYAGCPVGPGWKDFLAHAAAQARLLQPPPSCDAGARGRGRGTDDLPARLNQQP